MLHIQNFLLSLPKYFGIPVCLIVNIGAIIITASIRGSIINMEVRYEVFSHGAGSFIGI